MFSSLGLSTLTGALMLSTVSAQMTTSAASSSSVRLIPTPSKQLDASEIVSIGCFKTAVPLEDHGPYKFQTEGNCQQICLQLDKNVMALSEGTNCWCGDLIPPASAKVNDSFCDTTCAGFKPHFCGGADHYWVDLTGNTLNKVPNFEPKDQPSSTNVAAQTSQARETAIVTESPKPSEGSNGPNKVGIAVGVVVGVLVLGAIIGGVVFYLRQKRRRDVEEEYRRQAAVNSFVGGKLHTSNSSITDSRLDPEFMNRRQSNGSIADNEDYSRRILKVTNA